MAQPFNWDIDRIACSLIIPNGSVLPTTNSQRSTVVGLPQDIWLRNMPPVNDGVDGSLNPITIKVPNTPDAGYKLPISIVPVNQFPLAWNPLLVIVQGLLNGVVVLQSTPFRPGSKGPMLTIDAFRVVSTLAFVDTTRADYSFWIPFRLAGDFEWQCQVVEPQQPGIIAPCQTTTRLEMNFALASPLVSSPTQNLLQPPSNIVPSQPDFQGMYPVLAQRYAFPNLSELAQPNLQTFQAARQWYVERIVNNVWQIGRGLGPKPYYDTILGAAGYDTGRYGGVFNLTKWSNPQIGMSLNCYDLAAVVQLACCLALDTVGAELITTSWVYQTPNGYVPDGELFGWNGVPCNNPFYNNANYDRTAITKVESCKRSGFSSHAWIEVSFNGTTRVLDLTHALYVNGVATPERGTKTRVRYLNDNQDKQYPQPPIFDIGDAYNNINGSVFGDCYLSPDARIPRIGIFGTDFAQPYDAPNRDTLTIVNFVDSTPYVSIERGHHKLPLATRSELRSLIQKGINRPFSLGFSNASLRQKTLVHLTSQVFGGAAISVLYAQLDPYKDFTRRSLVLSLHTKSPHHSEKFVEVRVSLDIEVHCTHQTAIQSLLSFSDTITAHAWTQLVKGSPKPLGDVSLSAADIIIWIHGNVYIKLRRLNIHDESGQIPQEDTILSVDRHITMLADALEQHLASGDTDGNSVHRPTISTLSPFPGRFSSTSVVTVEACRNASTSSDVNDVYEERVVGHVSDPSLMLCCGPSDAAGRVSFAALGKAGRTTVTLIQAHHDNLMPGMKSYEIEIFDDEVIVPFTD